MAYDLKKLTGAPMPRYADHTANPEMLRGKDAIQQKQIEFLNGYLDILENLGIELSADKKAPVKNGVPSLFILQKDENGMEKQVDLGKAGIEIGSRDFWYQAQLGNLFAYPSGSRDPVQIHGDFHSYRPELSISGPIKPENIPVQKTADDLNHVYRRPNWFTRMMNSVFPDWRKKDCEIYRQQEALKKTFADTAAKRTDDRMKEELSKTEEAEIRAQAGMEKKALEATVNNISEKISNKTKGKQVYQDHIAPTPVFHEEYMKENKGSGYYDRETFSGLKVIDKKLEDYAVGGKPISQEEYAGLVAACSLDPKNALLGYPTSPEYDATAIETFVNLGYDKAKAEEIVTNSFTTMITTDHMKGDLRNAQGVVLGLTVNPARMDVFDALDKYKQGDKKPLAQAIARGITVAASDTMSRTQDNGDNIYNHTEFAAATADLLDRDPELMKLATEAYGLEEGDIQAVKGLAAISKADSEKRDAQLKLATAALNGAELTAEEKRQCAEKIVTANLMVSKMASENHLQKKSADPQTAESQRLHREAAENNLVFAGEQLKRYAQHPKERPMPPRGKLYYDQVGTLMNGRNGEFNVHPDTVLHVSDAEGVEDMKKIAAKIVENESLAEMSTKELNGALVMDKEKYMGTGLVVKGREAVLGKKAEDPELERQKQKELEEEKLNPLETGFDLGHL